MEWADGPNLQLDGCEIKTDLLEWQRLGLRYTASGYGPMFPTARKVWYHGKWRRIYCSIWGNSGTYWIIVDGDKRIVE